jgi:addiction module HigA family antidote
LEPKEEESMIPKYRKPTHPGQILLEDFLQPRRMNPLVLGEKMGVSVQQINTLINGKRDVSAKTAVLLARTLKTTPEFWMNLQASLDLSIAAQKLTA